jgi:hypothetical protein
MHPAQETLTERLSVMNGTLEMAKLLNTKLTRFVFVLRIER